MLCLCRGRGRDAGRERLRGEEWVGVWHQTLHVWQRAGAPFRGGEETNAEWRPRCFVCAADAAGMRERDCGTWCADREGRGVLPRIKTKIRPPPTPPSGRGQKEPELAAACGQKFMPRRAPFPQLAKNHRVCISARLRASPRGSPHFRAPARIKLAARRPIASVVRRPASHPLQAPAVPAPAPR